MKRTLTLLFIQASFILFSCQKELYTSDLVNEAENSSKKKATTVTTNSTVSFDWETDNYVPAKGNTNPLLLPWKSGTTAIHPQYADDFKKADGWVLAYNTFSPEIYLNDANYNYYFALYNRFRGLLRFYHWIPSSSSPSSYIQHGLALYGNTNSNLLNFNAVDIVSKTNQSSFSLIENQMLTHAGGSWYVFEYEMSYDPNISNTTFPSFGISMVPSWVNITQVNLGGSSSGNIDGTIGTSGSSFNLLGFVQKSAMTLMGGTISQNILALLKPLSATNAAKYETDLKSTVSEAGKGTVKGIVNGILGLGGTGDNYQKVKLNIKTDIKLNGTMTSNGSLLNIKLAIPGQSNATNNFGVTLAEPMGIFSLSSAPIVKNIIDTHQVQYTDDQYNETTTKDYSVNYLTIDNSSYSILWNPSIINNSSTGAHIENLQIQLVNSYDAFYPNGISTTFGGLRFQDLGNSQAVAALFYEQRDVYVGENLTEETNGKNTYALSKPNSSAPFVMAFAGSGAIQTQIGVRFIFDVVPNNGSKRSKIIKTFDAKVNYSYRDFIQH
ncbi:hypothetical protein BV902_22610 [Sphingobacterium sp. B29]|uniref:hypothetical protein n=1 Tax=Sphingobacterium sp. B29 TaxID=1933220 RepID=UPI0009586545|nr:hypothetical protein [Sphingobacterium sp. B29]APU98786.1 hypothetical protein BV902_22610 [Sphingobacterium sp. B29]